MSKPKPEPALTNAIQRLSNLFENGNLSAAFFPDDFINQVCDEIIDLRQRLGAAEIYRQAVPEAEIAIMHQEFWASYDAEYLRVKEVVGIWLEQRAIFNQLEDTDKP